MKARFSDIRWNDSTLTFNASLGDLSKALWIRLPEGSPRPDDDLIAGVFASLAGPNLEAVSMELSLTNPIRVAIESFCGCELDCGSRTEGQDWISGYDNHALSFSGGFDSLAALALLPDQPTLVSMDFGGWFQRETDFFSKFSPYIVSTNFRMEGFGRRSWIFMLAGIILLKQHLDIGRYTTGSILESSPWHYRKYIDSAPKSAPLLQAFGLTQLNTTIGITEVATTLVTLHRFPSYVKQSLKSLAAPGTGKSQRKQMLVASLCAEGRAILDFVPEVEAAEVPPLTWGDSLTDDMLTPYMLKHSGTTATNRLMAGIPDEVHEAAASLNLTFYERYHTGLYSGLGLKENSHIHSTLSSLGVGPFTERDWAEYRQVTDIISRYHRLVS